MSREHRVGFVVGLITVIVVLILLAIIERAGSLGESMPKTTCPASVEDSQKIRRMMERGFDNAFQAQIGQLFKIYGQNAPSVEKQRQYTRTGIENAITAYRIAIEAVNAWEC